MTATDIEVDVYTIDVADGASLTDQVLATVNGAIKEISITRVSQSPGSNKYNITVVHDDVGTTSLEWSSRQVTVTQGTPITDQVFGTIAGVAQASKAIIKSVSNGVAVYDVIIVHLNA